MNGHDFPELFSSPDDYREDDNPIQQVNIECPFCGHHIHWTGTRLACFNCEIIWQDASEVEHDRRESNHELE